MPQEEVQKGGHGIGSIVSLSSVLGWFCTAELQCGEAWICWQIIKGTVPAVVLHPTSVCPDGLVHIWLPYEKVVRLPDLNSAEMASEVFFKFSIIRFWCFLSFHMCTDRWKMILIGGMQGYRVF